MKGGVKYLTSSLHTHHASISPLLLRSLFFPWSFHARFGCLLEISSFTHSSAHSGVGLLFSALHHRTSFCFSSLFLAASRVAFLVCVNADRTYFSPSNGIPSRLTEFSVWETGTEEQVRAEGGTVCKTDDLERDLLHPF